MEETNERIGNSDKRRSAKIEIIGGSGLGGILMVGGTLAALALIGVFTHDIAKKKKENPLKEKRRKGRIQQRNLSKEATTFHG
ncbi:hypothetical protein Sjap_006887 [Stephania japonica]|uniref:Uncharacterized protein n=1 Tax=Stephania japonica TaxID=461633 RepID=A0AAP0K887_9MAGN